VPILRKATAVFLTNGNREGVTHHKTKQSLPSA
jgi:hypothetical protein